MAASTSHTWQAALAAAFVSATLLAACGGGGSGATADTPASATTPTAAVADTYSQGPISGFGSIVVGGVRYDDSRAVVTDEDGVSSTRSALKLGMTVQVDAGAVTRAAGISSASSATSASAVASRIRFGSEIVGPVSAVDNSAGTLQVLGQVVTVTSATVFDDTLVGGLAALTSGAVIEVHGIRDTATGATVATRIEPKAGATRYRLRGAVAALDSTAKTFKIGSATVNYAAVTPAPTGLANGQTVRVLLQTTTSNGAWVATAVNNGLRLPEGTVREAHIEGVITAYTSSTAFTVNGFLVDASSATFPDGTSGIVLGARVEVTGSVTNGKLVATQVEIEERRDAGKRALELHGDITSIDTAAKTFVLRGITVWYGGTVTYTNGAESGLAVGKSVDVRGVLAADRTRFEARSIELKGTTTSTTG